MKEMMRYGLILAAVCMVASGLLAGVNSATRPKIIAQAQAEEEASLKEVMPQAERFEPVKLQAETIYYRAYDRGGKPIGAAFRVSGKGYSSTIETMVGMLEDGTIAAIKVLSQNETPGLGARVSEPDFTSQFTNRKGLSGVHAITGATISSKAVIEGVKGKAEEIRGLLKNAK